MAPTLPLMHAAFILTGLGTLLLGPILPLLAARWHLNDSQSGLLILAQFCGSTTGGATVTSRLSRDLLLGLIAGAIGFSAFAFAPGLMSACIALALGGFGVGRMIASVNILAGNRYSRSRGSALALLNFTWGFGALLSPLLAATLVPRISLPRALLGFAACFALLAVCFLVQLRTRSGESSPAAQETSSDGSFRWTYFLYFVALLFIYGGLETCFGAWLTTYALRFGRDSLVLSQYTTVLLLGGITVGRALTSWLLLTIEDRRLQRLALGLSALLCVALAATRQPVRIAALAVLLGLALAPIFPATFAIYMGSRPPARSAGLVLAASGLGAAALPWLMGVISTQTGSLQTALLVPLAAALGMLLLSLFPVALRPRLSQEVRTPKGIKRT